MVAILFVIPVKIFNIRDRYVEFSILLAYFPFIFGERIRFFFYKYTLEQVGSSTRFKFGSYVQYRTVKIGKNVLIGHFNSIGECEIGDDVLLGGDVKILSGLSQHNFSKKSEKIVEQGGCRKKIYIGSDVFIGTGAIIASNISDGCVISTGSIVVKDTEKYGIYIGSKSEFLRFRE
jgi:acetyltransferase-like isoleucine patch superfamily enzyme